MQLPDRLQLPWQFDAATMAEEVAAQVESDWIAHFVTQNYQGDWSVIPLRGPKGAEHPVMMIYSDPGCEAFEDTPFLKRAPYLQEVLNTFACPLEAVRLMRLGPGSVIKEHTDHDLAFEMGMVRLHIPIATSAQVVFRLNGERVRLDAGTCWCLRLSDPHEVQNAGEDARIHLVIDARVNEWLEEVMKGVVAPAG